MPSLQHSNCLCQLLSGSSFNIIKLFLKLGSCFPSSRATDCPNVLPPPKLIKHHLPSVGYWRCLWRVCSSSHRGIIIFFFSEALVVNLHCALSSLNYPSRCGEQTVLVWVEQIGNKWPTTTHDDVFPPCFQFCCAVCLGTQTFPKNQQKARDTLALALPLFSETQALCVNAVLNTLNCNLLYFKLNILSIS